MERLRVFIAADDPAEGARLSALLEAGDGFDVAGRGPLEPDSAALRDADPDVVVVAPGRESGSGPPRVSWPDIEGLAVLALVSLPDDTAAMIAAGARGVLPSDPAGTVLNAAVRAIASGLIVVDPEFAAVVTAPRDRDAGVSVEVLTPRELEVLQVLAEGCSNKEIARRLGVSDHTVKFHVDAILSKLDAHTRTEAVTRAARQGLIIL